MIILDFGSGNTCKNDIKAVERMIDELKAVDKGKHEVFIKWQLFQDAPPNKPLEGRVFSHAHNYAQKQGYKTTASVFDPSSLKFLLDFDIPFIKLANRPDLYCLAEEVPKRMPVYISVRGPEAMTQNTLACVSEYPADAKKYEEIFGDTLKNGISDHTTDFYLWHKYQPKVIEWHYKLEDSTGPDSGPFARTPEQLREILS